MGTLPVKYNYLSKTFSFIVQSSSHFSQTDFVQFWKNRDLCSYLPRVAWLSLKCIWRKKSQSCDFLKSIIVFTAGTPHWSSTFYALSSFVHVSSQFCSCTFCWKIMIYYLNLRGNPHPAKWEITWFRRVSKWKLPLLRLYRKWFNAARKVHQNEARLAEVVKKLWPMQTSSESQGE